MSMGRKVIALLFLLALACASALAEYRLDSVNCYINIADNDNTSILYYFADITNTGDTWLCLNNSKLYALDGNGRPVDDGALFQIPDTLLPGEHGYLYGCVYFFKEDGTDPNAVRSYSISLKRNPKHPPRAILYPRSSWYLNPDSDQTVVLCMDNDTGEALKNPSFLLVLRGKDKRILYMDYDYQLDTLIPPGSGSENEMFRYGLSLNSLPDMGYSLDGATLEYLVWGVRDATTGG